MFFLRSQAEQVWRLEKKIEREKIVLAVLSKLSLQFVEFAGEHGCVTMMDASKLTGASRNTLKQHFRDLAERNHLEQHGTGRGVWYGLGLNNVSFKVSDVRTLDSATGKELCALVISVTAFHEIFANGLIGEGAGLFSTAA